MGGYTGKVLRINLTEGKTSTEPLNMELARKYLSGRGLAGKMFADEVASDVDALAPENKLFITSGLLTGTNAPTSGRFMVVTKSPLNGVIASSNSGGYWGAQLKFARYDMVVLEGKADHPVYISIKDDLVEIKDASQLWGKDVYATTEALKLEFGDDKAKVITIGPAGENLSLIAAIMNDLFRAAGRSGVGAVMGSKNVKAIVVRGTGKVENANPDEMKKVLSAALGKIKENGVTGGENMTAKHLIKKDACYRCPINCGRYSKWEGAGPEYETVWVFGSNSGVHDYDAVHAANDLCNKLGLDTISVGATISAGMELVQRGYIKPEELDGTPLEFGNAQGMLEWVRKIAYVEGLGAQGLQFATSNRGGCHDDRGYMISPEILGLPEKLDRESLEGKATWVKISQDLTAVIDAVGMCLFTSFTLGLSDYAAIVNAVTGENYSDEELLACGERIWNNERLHNLKVGYTAAEDTLPKRLLNDPIPDGPSKGSVHRLAELLPQYYTERGWDEAGVPTPERLNILGM